MDFALYMTWLCRTGAEDRILSPAAVIFGWLSRFQSGRDERGESPYKPRSTCLGYAR